MHGSKQKSLYVLKDVRDITLLESIVIKKE